jgi:ABC-2 type transport system permease protein
MKIAFRIARLELSNLFYSPVAWVVLVIFMIQSGWEFSHLIERMERSQQMGMGSSGVTGTLFSGYVGVFTKMKEYLYLYIPLLTMGLISRETGSGSIKLVYSSPVKVSAVVWGKYLAMVAYCVLLMLCLGLLEIIAGVIIKDADLSFISSGIIGLFLQICAYSAIGLFMSSLTTYQVVAAISTLALLAGLNYVGNLWQDIDFVRDLTYFLSISGRVDEFIEGLISSKDVFYFVIVICMFVGITILKLKGDRESRSPVLKSMRYAILIASALLTGYITARPQLTVYKDMTANKRRTLTPNTQQIVRKLKDPLTVTTYVNLLDQNYYSGLPSSRNTDLARYDQYFRFKHDIDVKYVYYYDTAFNNVELFMRNKGLPVKEVARKMTASMKLDFKDFLSPAEIRKIIDLSSEQNRVVRVLQYGNKTAYLRMYDDIMRQPSEKEFAAALKRLAVIPPKAIFLKGHNERSIRRMGDNDIKLPTTEITFRSSLVNQGFDVDELSLEDADLPADVAVLVIADPGTPYSSVEMNKIKNYLNAGGNLLIAGEPKRRDIIKPLLDLIGVKLDAGVILQKSEDFAPSLFHAPLTPEGMQLLGARPSPRLMAGMVFPGVATLSWDSSNAFKVTPLIVANTLNSIRRTAQIDDSLRSVEFSDVLHDEKGAFPVVIGLTRKINKKEQRILVSGDADFMSNAELLRSNIQTGNFTFMMELFRWFSFDDFPVDTYREPSTDNAILTNANGVSMMTWFLLVVLPGITVIAVAIMLVRRKRR